MRKLLVVLTIGLFSVACLPDLTGIEDVDNYATSVVTHGEVASVVCSAVSVPVGGTIQCHAFNAAGTMLRADGITVVLWSSSDPATARVELDGIVTGIAAGTAEIQAEGTRGSSASASVTVQ
jgi:hypothetical protein